MTIHIQSRVKKLLMFLVAISVALGTFIFFQSGASGAIIFEAKPAIPNSDTQISLNWSPVNGAVAYKIVRDEGTASQATAATIKIAENANYTSYIDAGTAGLGLVPETSYSYTLHAYSDGNMTAEIALTGNIKTAITTKMIKPTITSAKYDINSKMITLVWINNSKATLASKIINSKKGTTMTPATATATTATFSDPDLDPLGSDYVVAGTGLNLLQSDLSDAVTVMPVNAPSIGVSIASGMATVTWDSFAPIAQFNLERSKFSISGNTWSDWVVVISQLSTGAIQAVNTPADGGLYRYRLNAKSDSSYTGSIMTQPVSKPAAPTNLTAVLLSKNQVNLTWTKNADNYSGLRVERKDGNGVFTALVTLDSFVDHYSDIYAFSSGTTYTYRVTAYESANSQSSSNEFTISTAVPSAPTDLKLVKTVTNSGPNPGTKITLTWTDNASSEAGYSIDRKTGSSEYAWLKDVDYNTTTWIDDQAGSSITYTYRVYARNPFGNSAYSNEVSVDGSASVAAPATLTITAASSTQLDLAWSYGDTLSHSTIVERKTGTDGAWSTIYTAASGVYKYSDTGLSPNTYYYYRVRSYISAGVTSASYPANDTGIGSYTMLSGLSLSGSAASGNTIQLSWSGNSGSADVIIERKMSSGSFAALATVSSSTTGWSDTTGLIQGASYTYRIKAKNSTNESIYSGEVTVLNVYLDAPSNLTSTAGTGNVIELKWTDNSSDETGFEIWRYVYGSGTYQLYATVDKNTTTFTDKNIVSGVQYNYMVRSYMTSPAIYSSYTGSAGAGLGLLQAPSNLQYSVVSNTQAVLYWTDNSSTESGFKLERRLPGETVWTQVAWLSANTTSYTITGLTPYVNYLYRVRVYSYSGNFDSYSNEIEISTGVPLAPTDIKADAVSASEVKLSWTDNANNETGYRIDKYIIPLVIISTAEVGPGVTKYTDKGLYPNTEYTYRVSAVNKNATISGTEVKVTTLKKSVFKDMTAGYSWASEAIESLAGRGVLQGDNKNRFNPGSKITKAEFTALVLRAFNLDSSTPVGSMADVKPGKWYYKEIMIAENLGIISRDRSGRFYPERAVTREEMAVIITRTMAAVGKPLPGYGNSVLEKFADKGLISTDALASVASMAGEGIMTGRTASSIAPKDTATRAEAAVMIYKIIDR